MAKYGESFGKKEKEKKRLQMRNEKAEKMADRKANVQKGKPLEDMMAYLDENGNLTSKPPDPLMKKRMFKSEDIQIGVPKQEDRPKMTVRSGVVNYYTESKGFGFINDLETGERIFFHKSHFPGVVQEGMKVSFEVEAGPRGYNAILIKKLDQ
jgi:cold shock CspA family protein